MDGKMTIENLFQNFGGLESLFDDFFCLTTFNVMGPLTFGTVKKSNSKTKD